ncbi:M23 family metallopeptidase [Methylobacterium planeticum]|uniref:Peptidoglycan DD-metalloendopeptidase family protein n=1 Tax=Methylobacterium planeticum TaxID=2615211 RepID=A0A6N6MYT4_9HYPH|nr:M23 family metallopeptidase [Methylobacterium planeticum]KAB1076263.1 peptidoglycan DD-metalloendopeptidase family protein [Methylobacterium planeticum]
MQAPVAAETLPTGRKARGRRTTLLLGCGLALTTLWGCAASYVLVFHDEMMGRFMARQVALQTAYESRLADLQARLDRAASDRSLTREAVEVRLSVLAERLEELTRQQAVLAEVVGETPSPLFPDPVGTGSLPEPEPLALRTRDAPPPRERRSAREIDARLAALENRLEAAARVQARSLDRIGRSAGRRAEQLRGLVAGTGLDPVRFERPAPGLGGPLVPISADPFTQALAQVQRSVGDEARLRRVAATLPLRRPLLGEYSLSSGFGTRLDPFTRGLALHTGLDLKAETGEPARATAPGRVTVAEAAGGYGNMVEIDHGHGVVTRYAHLARLGVTPGQWVQAGEIVGRVGSTGRSTGSHLHYETRIDGEPVDPQRFLRAGTYLDAWRFNGR